VGEWGGELAGKRSRPRHRGSTGQAVSDVEDDTVSMRNLTLGALNPSCSTLIFAVKPLLTP
jgi:hypothetical protein